MTFLRLPHTITVTIPTTSTDAYGVAVLVHGAGTTMPASVQPLSSDEQTDGTGSAGRTTTRCRVFTRTQIPMTARIVWGARTWEVVSSQHWSDASDALDHWETEVQEVAG